MADLHRSVFQYQKQDRSDEALRKRLRELANERRRFGYRRLGILLAREGFEGKRCIKPRLARLSFGPQRAYLGATRQDGTSIFIQFLPRGNLSNLHGWGAGACPSRSSALALDSKMTGAKRPVAGPIYQPQTGRTPVIRGANYQMPLCAVCGRSGVCHLVVLLAHFGRTLVPARPSEAAVRARRSKMTEQRKHGTRVRCSMKRGAALIGKALVVRFPRFRRSKGHLPVWSQDF